MPTRMVLIAVCLVGVSALGATAVNVASPRLPTWPALLLPAPRQATAHPSSRQPHMFAPRLHDPEGEWLRRSDGRLIWRVTVHQQCLVLHSGEERCREYEAPWRLHADLQPAVPGSKPGTWLLQGREGKFSPRKR